MSVNDKPHDPTLTDHLLAQGLLPNSLGQRDDKLLLNGLANELKLWEQRTRNGQACLRLIIRHFEDAVCIDPGPFICNQLALPLLQERLYDKAWIQRMESALTEARKDLQDTVCGPCISCQFAPEAYLKGGMPL